MKYHSSGAISVVDSAPSGTPDDLQGQFDASGNLRVLIDDTTYTGYYDPTGATRVSDQSLETDITGTYAEDGSINGVFVDGTELVGVYSPIGARNYFLQT
jgi:hypothetical protein